MNKGDQILERINLEKKSRQEINDLLFMLGFFKKSSEEEELSDEKCQTLHYKTTYQLEEEAETGDEIDEDREKEEL